MDRPWPDHAGFQAGNQAVLPQHWSAGESRLSGAPAEATAQRAASTSTAMCVAFIAASLEVSFTAAWKLAAYPTEPAPGGGILLFLCFSRCSNMGLDPGLHPLILIFFNRLHAVIAPEAGPHAHMIEAGIYSPCPAMHHSMHPTWRQTAQAQHTPQVRPRQLADGRPRC